MDTIKNCKNCYWNSHYNIHDAIFPAKCSCCSNESTPSNPYPQHWLLTEVDDSDKELETNTNGALKFDGEKPRMDLLDRYALEQLASVLTFGAKKYAAHNWRKGLQYSRLVAAAMRHIQAFNDGEDNDPESGLSHVAHAMCCMMFLLGTINHRPDMDDRWPTTLEKYESV